MLTLDQILDYLRENPDWVLPEDATEEEAALYDQAREQLGLDGEIDDGEDDDWDDEDWDDNDDDWGDDDLEEFDDERL